MKKSPIGSARRTRSSANAASRPNVRCRTRTARTPAGDGSGLRPAADQPPLADTDGLFTAGADYLVVETPREMTEAIAWLAEDAAARARLGAHARATILARHTCLLRTRRILDSWPRSGIRMRLTFFGSSLVSSYWNGAATYYRGVCKALHARGYEITFVEQDIYERQAHRDLIADPPYARVQVLDVSAGLRRSTRRWPRPPAPAGSSSAAASAPTTTTFRSARWRCARPGRASPSGTWTRPSTSPPPAPIRRRLRAGAFPAWDAVFTYGGGPRVVAEYSALGARAVHPIYNAVDPDDYSPCRPTRRRSTPANLLLMANRMPDREARVWDLFGGAAARAPEARFVLGGAGWEGAPFPPNVRLIGHVPTADHARRNCSARLVLNVNRPAMAEYGYSPPTRIFEAAGLAACLITDAWPGVAQFLEPGREILVAADAAAIARYVRDISWPEARAIGARRPRPRPARSHLRSSAPAMWTPFCAARAHEPRLLRPGHHLVLGERPRHDLSRPAARAGRAGPSVRLSGAMAGVLPIERRPAAPAPPAMWTCASTRTGTTRPRRRWPPISVAAADVVVVGSYCFAGCRRSSPGCSTGPAAPRRLLYYDIDTPVTLEALARDGATPYLAGDATRRLRRRALLQRRPHAGRRCATAGARATSRRSIAASTRHALSRPARRPLPLRPRLHGRLRRRPPRHRARAAAAPRRRPARPRFLIAGAQYPDVAAWPANVTHMPHLYPRDHAAFYSSNAVTLNATRGPMIRAGYCPSVRLFEAAGCGACILSDRWPGLADPLTPGEEIRLADETGDALAYLDRPAEEKAALGRRARARALRDHTYAARAAQLERYLAAL